MTRRTPILVLLLGMVVAPARAQAPSPVDKETKTLNLTAYAELLRSDVRAEKVAIITEVMGFSDEDSAKFWPIYREYDSDMAKLGDERVALIEDYAAHYETMTDAAADALATKAIDLEGRRRAAIARCYQRVKSALSARVALRFLQVEHQLQSVIDLQISAALPIAK